MARRSAGTLSAGCRTDGRQDAGAAPATASGSPLRESAHRTLVRVHLTEGNTTEALRAYAFFREMLLDELGVLPTEQMTRLVRSIPQRRDEATGAHPSIGESVLRSRAVVSSAVASGGA